MMEMGKCLPSTTTLSLRNIESGMTRWDNGELGDSGFVITTQIN